MPQTEKSLPSLYGSRLQPQCFGWKQADQTRRGFLRPEVEHRLRSTSLANDANALLIPAPSNAPSEDLNDDALKAEALRNGSKGIRGSEDGLTGWERVASTRNSRSGTVACVALSCVVLLVNVIFTVAASAKFGIQEGVGTLFSGSCTTVDNWSTGLHITINMLSSLLLAASSYVMQIISAPTRHELDQAHQKGDWLDIGVLSVRNVFKRISTRVTPFWILLGLSSLPIHLLYNSAIFKTTVAFNYMTALAKPDFATAATNITRIYGYDFSPCAIPFFAEAETNGSLVANLTTSECISEYGVQTLNRRSDVLLISDCAEAFSANFTSKLWQIQAQGGGYFSPYNWMCNFDSARTSGNCLPSAADWTINGCKVNYCLSRLEEAQSKLKFSLYILLAVILCNVTKAIVMTWILVFYREDALLTVGDAIASYLICPDQYSAGNCMATRNSIKSKHFTGPLRSRITPVKMHPASTQFWATAASRKRWYTTLGLCFTGIVAASILLGFGVAHVRSEWNEHPWQLGFGSVNTDATFDTIPPGFGFASNVLMANIPQAIISFLYISYNGLWTTMLLASEWNSYYLQPHSLRVTHPKGRQRSTYWLHLPYRVSIPLLVAITTLHWLISESLFAVQIQFKDDITIESFEAIYGMASQTETAILLGWSNIPILLSITLGSLMLITVILVGLRKLPNPMPLASSCSLAIAAACHAPEYDENAAFFPVSWGAITPADTEIGHCCFTTQSVHPPVPGKLYA